MNDDSEALALTDGRAFAQRFLAPGQAWRPLTASDPESGPEVVLRPFFPGDRLYRTGVRLPPPWTRLLFTKTSRVSHYDLLIRLARSRETDPGEIICLAGSGSTCHGFQNRPWQALDGNLHLSLLLAPERRIEHAAAAFLALPAVALLDVLDSVPGLEKRAGIKWVNDILLAGCKVGGVLAHTRIQGDVAKRVVLGVGLNVAASPEVLRDPFAPKADSLCNLTDRPPGPLLPTLLNRLLLALSARFTRLMTHGPEDLLDDYRTRSLVLGSTVRVRPGPDAEEVSGRVARIGRDLELYLEGRPRPLTSGRLRFHPPAGGGAPEPPTLSTA